jgi:hypothetical protein
MGKMTASLFIIGTALASWITLRNPGYFPGQPGWPARWEWAVGTLGIVLITIATGRVMWAALL